MQNNKLKGFTNKLKYLLGHREKFFDQSERIIAYLLNYVLGHRGNFFDQSETIIAYLLNYVFGREPSIFILNN